MELRTALKISAGAHGALMVWALASGWFSADFDEAMEVTEVTLISGDQFAALVEQAGAGEPAMPVETAPVEAPEPAEAAPVDAVPEPVAPPPTETRELAETPGDTPTPAPRVAPRPADRPDPNVAEAPEVVEAAEPVEAEATPEPVEAPEATAPEAATTRIVTEATETGGAEEIVLAPTATPRPRTRPDRPEPEPEPVAEVPEEAAPEEEPDVMEAAVASALADALAGGGAPTGDPGPPMTTGERDALRLAVQSCWVVDVGSEAANVTVVVGMSMSPEGKVVDGSLQMIEASGGSETAIRTAFQSARRAVLRCQRDGYDLPAEKYAQWQEIEMVFNPSDMRIR